MMTRNSYIMREQVGNPIPSIMRYRVTQRSEKCGRGMYLISVATVTFVYLLAMALSAD